MTPIDRALRAGAIVPLVGGADVDAETIVKATVADRKLALVTVACDGDTTAEAIPEPRVPEWTLVDYANFGALPDDVQVTAAQHIKGHFEYGIPEIVESSAAARSDPTLRNGDLAGRVRAIELDTYDCRRGSHARSAHEIVSMKRGRTSQPQIQYWRSRVPTRARSRQATRCVSCHP